MNHKIETALQLIELGLYDETQFKLELIKSAVMTNAFNDSLNYLGIQEVQFEHDSGTQRWMDLSHKALEISKFSIVMKTAYVNSVGDIQVPDRISYTIAKPEPAPHKFCIKVKLIDYYTVGLTRSLAIEIEPDFTITDDSLAGAQKAILGTF